MPEFKFKAKIINKAGIVVAEMDAWIEFRKLGPDEEWYGFVELPKNHQFDLNVREYRIRLDDGREGDFFWTEFDQVDSQVDFQGSGPLKKP